MRYLSCPNCESRLFFDADTCLSCGALVGYEVTSDQMQLAGPDNRCTNHEAHACNWMAEPGFSLCRACAFVINPLALPDSIEVTRFQLAIRRTFRQFVLHGINPANGPILRFECVKPGEGDSVTIGHADGLVTLDVSEADPVVLTEQRERLGERYRTPLGHVRHESGHWHWQSYLEPNPDLLEEFRLLFGDERSDYSAALEQHYARTDDGSWVSDYLSFYASSHPWEDYAESFAHILHMTDTVTTAFTEGLVTQVPTSSFDHLYAVWQPLTVALNELSRSMGLDDPYPFTPTKPAVDKLRFVYRASRTQR